MSMSPKSPQPSVLVIILNWNSHEETIAAVHSVLQMNYPNCRIALIDNGSEQQSVDEVRKLAGDRVELILSPQNLGYTGGCNLGFDLALQTNADYVWLLNNDAVTAPDTLMSLVNVAESDPKIALVSPIVASKERHDEILAICGMFDPNIPSYGTTRKFELAKEWLSSYPDRITLLGTALLVRVSALRKIGKFDDALFAYWEDTDLALRANKAGFHNMADFNSVIYHSMDYPNGSATGIWPHEAKPHFWYYMARNEIYFWKKHAPVRKLKALWWAYVDQLRSLQRIEGKPALQRALLAGIWDGWLNRQGMWDRSRSMPAPLANAVLYHSRRKFSPKP